MTDTIQEPITIRGRSADDWRAIAAICRALPPEFNPLQVPYPSDDFAREEIGKIPDNEYTFGLVAQLNGTLVGEIALVRERQRRRHMGRILRLIVDPAQQNKGIGGALLGALIDVAENWANLSRIEHLIQIDNAPALALHRRHGFVIEGRLRDYFYRDGRYLDAYMMARIRDAF